MKVLKGFLIMTAMILYTILVSPLVLILLIAGGLTEVALVLGGSDADNKVMDWAFQIWWVNWGPMP